ncbi:hypothetical protein [Halorussus ruber]|uniref:hypothetical protein n=1 Tax=Halorussus ruber TaxID=1126238 RepID=UPI001092B071|nr:hypothetical protein [Halorussus ruber]
MHRRRALRVVALGASASLAGCFGMAHRTPPEEGELTVRNMDDEPHEVALTLSDGDETVLEESYDLDADRSSPKAIVEPATYDLSVTLDGGRTEQFEWDVTSCRSIGSVQIWDGGEIRFETSNC